MAWISKIARKSRDSNQALIANRPGDAVPLARQAVALAPDTASHRLLLMTALMLDGQLAAAEDAATDALRQDDENTVALVMRGYLRQRQGKTEEADADFDAALKQDWLDDSQRRNVRLIAADAALAGARAPARWPWWNRWAPRTRPAPIASSAPAPAPPCPPR